MEEYADHEIGAPEDSADERSDDERQEFIEQHLTRLIDEQMSLADNARYILFFEDNVVLIISQNFITDSNDVSFITLILIVL